MSFLEQTLSMVDLLCPHTAEGLAQLSSVLRSVLLSHHWDFIWEHFFFFFTVPEIVGHSYQNEVFVALC